VFSVPIVALYEFSIGIARMAVKKRELTNPSLSDLP